jgi:hypothetical protein
LAAKEEATTTVSQEIAATTAGDALLVHGPHLLLHKDNLTVPLLVNALERQTLIPLTGLQQLQYSNNFTSVWKICTKIKILRILRGLLSI